MFVSINVHAIAYRVSLQAQLLNVPRISIDKFRQQLQTRHSENYKCITYGALPQVHNYVGQILNTGKQRIPKPFSYGSHPKIVEQRAEFSNFIRQINHF